MQASSFFGLGKTYCESAVARRNAFNACSDSATRCAKPFLLRSFGIVHQPVRRSVSEANSVVRTFQALAAGLPELWLRRCESVAHLTNVSVSNR